MAELALLTTEFRNQKDKYLTLRPVGSVIVALSDRVIRAKWLEICCDLVSPINRDTPNYDKIPGWGKLCEAWTPELWAKWWHLQRPMKPGMVESWPADVREIWESLDKSVAIYPHGFLFQEPTAPAQLWQALIEPLGVLDDLPKEPTGQRPAYDAWFWSEHERKTFFIVSNTDANDTEVMSWGQHVGRVQETGEVLSATDVRWKDTGVNKVVGPRGLVKYETDIGLSGGTLADIADPEKVVHPRFDKPVSLANVVHPDTAMLASI